MRKLMAKPMTWRSPRHSRESRAFFVFDQHHALSGCYAQEAFDRVLRRVLADSVVA